MKRLHALPSLVAWIVFAVVAPTARAGDAFRTYKDKVPRANTAILITEDDRNPAFIGSYVATVDDQSVGSIWAGNVYAVRVLPGSHRFAVIAMFDKRGSLLNQGISYKTDGFRFEVADMKALHVYVTRWTITDGVVRVTIEDLGERPDYRTILAPKPRF